VELDVSQRTRILSVIQFTRHFIEYFVVETTRFGGNLNVTFKLTQQTCRQRPSRTAGGERRALAFCCFIRICNTFLILPWRGESDSGLCIISVLAKKMPLHGCRLPIKKRVWSHDQSEFANARWHFVYKYPSFAQTWTWLFSAFWYQEHIANSHAKKNASTRRLPAAFCSPARALAAGLPCQDHVYITTDELCRFHNREFDTLPCQLNYT